MNENILKGYYRDLYEKHGNSEKSLGWTKNKQNIRFFSLTKFFSMQEKRILDIGCGFGDMVYFLNEKNCDFSSYVGIDIVKEFIEVAKKNHIEDNTNFLLKNFIDLDSSQKFDLIFASGIFGHLLFKTDEEQYKYIDKTIKKSFEMAEIGISFDFISDKVDFKTSNKDFHANPSRVLEIAYKYSKNVILDNSIMPFEFSVIIFKDDSFKKERTIFNKFLLESEEL